MSEIYFISAYICPDDQEVIVVDDENPGLDVEPVDALTSSGVDIQPSDTVEVTSPDASPFRVMDVDFTVLGADTVTVTFTGDSVNPPIQVSLSYW